MMKKILIAFGLLLCVAGTKAADSALPVLEGVVDTTWFEPAADFEWHVSLQHDYASTMTTKLYLCSADFDERFKMRDNGKQEVVMTIPEAMEAVKMMDAVSMGMKKIVYLVGWQYLGHDSKYPALFEGNEAIKRPQDKDALKSVRWLMRKGHRLHTDVSLHINLFDCYDDSPLFPTYRDRDVLARDTDGTLITGDWGYKICYSREWEEGLLQERVDKLCSLLPVAKAGTIHVDAFHSTVPKPVLNEETGKWRIERRSPISPWHGFTQEQDMEAQRNIIRYFDSKGIDVTTEGMDQWNDFVGYIPMTWHFNDRHIMNYSAQQYTGGDSYSVRGRLVGQIQSVEDIFHDDTPLEERGEAFKRAFCLTTLGRDFLNRHERKCLLRNDKGDAALLFADDVCSSLVGGKMQIRQGDALLQDGGDVLMPACWMKGHNLVAFSVDGYAEREWLLPEGYPQNGKVRVYEVTLKGQKRMKTLRSVNGRIKLALNPGQMLRLKF